MKTASVDPSGHIRIAVSDLEKSRRFYAMLFARMGFGQISEKGWVSPEGFGMWIIQAAHPEHRYMFEAPGLHHICFKAGSGQSIDDLYNFLITQGIRVVAVPQFYPQYTPDYYAMFFLDPDGIKLEVAYY